MTRARSVTSLALAALVLAACNANMVGRGALNQAVEGNYEHRYADAVHAVDPTLRDGDADPVILQELYLQKAEAFEGMSQKSEAVALYRLVIDKYPESGAAWQAKGRLDALDAPCGR